MTLSSWTSTVISCASVNERIHSSSSNCFEVGSFFFLQEHELRVEEEAAFFQQVSRGPLDRENVRPSKQAPPLVCLAPAKETMASKCSCRSPVGREALMSASLT